MLDDALALAAGLDPPAARAQAFVALAARVAADKRNALLEESLRGVRTIDDPARRAAGLATLAPSFPASQRDEVLDEALVTIRAIPTVPARIRAFLILASNLPPGRRPDALAEALATSRNIADPKRRVEALTGLAACLSDPERDAILKEALAAVATMPAGDWHARWKALARLGPLLTERLLGQALASARAIGDDAAQARTLAILCAGLDEPESHRVLQETLVTVWRLPAGRERARALAALASQLVEPTRTAAIEVALADAASIQGTEDTALVIAALAPHCSGRLIADALHIAGAIDNGGWRTRALVALIRHLPLQLLGHAREMATQLERPGWRVQALAALALRLPDQQLRDLLREARAEVAAIDGAEHRLRALTALVPLLSGDEQLRNLRQTLDALSDVGQVARWRALANLAPYLPDTDRLRQVSMALDEALAQDCAESQVRPLLVLASYLPVAARDEALKSIASMAWMLDESEERAGALEALADCATGLPAHRRYQLWQPALRQCATRGRQELIDDLPPKKRLDSPRSRRRLHTAVFRVW